MPAAIGRRDGMGNPGSPKPAYEKPLEEASQPDRASSNAAEELTVPLEQIGMSSQFVEPEPEDLSDLYRMWHRLDRLTNRHGPPCQHSAPGRDALPDPIQRCHPDRQFFLTLAES